MYKIGLTGGIASGKSTVSFWLKEKGARVIDADALAVQAVLPGSKGLSAIVRHFGEAVLTSTGELDRAALSKIVFHQPEERKILNSLLHGEILSLIKTETKALEGAEENIIFYDVPLLLEAGWEKLLGIDEVWLVYVNRETQIQRLMARNGYGFEDAVARLNSQWPLDKKCSYAQVIINNEGDRDALFAQLEVLWETRLQVFYEGGLA